ncbi:unnamed protein product (macronuclear) [Paramecium tetraurelia]|uniref:Uncharacterized protein n=1 Tax=Paramecium tetraurelia TaxID=5888 RepID=A0DKQ0_PARTE|nr:uncharacterized protein GSPATT00017947001 [Paramecium tetraurelia]CAK83617.1 unnamed protein product [Paramecium tetraurelia]|eukprot:XP_001451014.1 hypothetical protein (macronuclear) [Paramecium tetraurelia strain d4-2]
MIALEHCQQLLELYILEFSHPDEIYVHGDEPIYQNLNQSKLQFLIDIPLNMFNRCYGKRQSITLLQNTFQQEFQIKNDYGLFETYEPKPYLIVVDRDKSDDKYRLEAMMKKRINEMLKIEITTYHMMNTFILQNKFKLNCCY